MDAADGAHSNHRQYRPCSLHEVTCRISTTRCDTDGGYWLTNRRCAPTSVPLRRNPRSRSPDSAFHISGIRTRREHTLVTSGPYRYIRHPFYVTSALALAANALTAANWFIALTGFAAVVLLVLRTATEEAKLVERFGDDYRRYMALTGRFFPRLRSASPPVE